MSIVARTIMLSINEVDLRERVFEVLKNNGITDDRATELSFAVCKEVRRVAHVTTTMQTTAEHVNPPLKKGPYR